MATHPATYMAVGNDGTIVCKGDGCSGDQTSGTTKHLRGVARAGIDRTSGSPLILAVGDGGACVRLVGDGLWDSLRTGTRHNLKSVSFAPRTRTAWVVGDEGIILKTTNGGSSFGVQTSPTSKNLHSVWAMNEDLVYVCGDGAGVWRTEDGGANWTLIHHAKPLEGPGVGTTKIDHGTFYSVHGVFDKVMAVGTDGGVIASHNRGEEWTAAKRLSPQKNLRAGWLEDDEFAIAVGDDGAIFVNPPGDPMWAEARAGRPVSLSFFHERDSGTSADLNGVILSGWQDSLLVVGDEGKVLRSTDEGSTWTKGTRGSKHLNAVA